MEATKKALDPRGLFNVVQRAALSPRPETLAGKTVYIINSWPGDIERINAQARKEPSFTDKSSEIKTFINL